MKQVSAASRVRSRRRGIALLATLLIVVLITVIVFSFQETVGREAAIARNNLDGTKAYFLAQMALVRGQATLRLDENADFDSLNEPWAQPPNWKGETFGAEFGATDEKPDEPKVEIADEERKFNLLHLVRGEPAAKKAAAEILKRLIDICRREDQRLRLDTSIPLGPKSPDREVRSDSLVENLVRYLEERPQEDSDDLEMGGRSSSAARIHKQTPFPMLTIGELLMVEGWNRELLYGAPRPVTAEEAGAMKTEADKDRAAGDARSFYDLTEAEKFEIRRKAFERQDENSSNPNPIGIAPFITLYSSGQININTCPRELLLALDPDITWDAVDIVITAREAARKEVRKVTDEGGTAPPEPDPNASKQDERSFRAADLASYEAFVKRVYTGDEQPKTTIEGLPAEIFGRIKPWLTVRSRVFTVLASATVEKTTRSLFAVYRRTGSNATANPAPTPNPNPNPTPNPAPTPTPATPTDPKALPQEPKIRLTLLLVDYSGD